MTRKPPPSRPQRPRAARPACLARALSLLLGLCLTHAAVAQLPTSVRLEPAQPVGHVGVPLSVMVRVNNIEQVPTLRVPDVPGLQIAQTTRTSVQTSVQITGGQPTVQRQTALELQVLARRPGEYLFGPVEVQADGANIQSEIIVLRFEEVSSSEDLQVRIVSPSERVYVGQMVPLELQILVRKSPARAAGMLTHRQAFSLIRQNLCSFGLFQPQAALQDYRLSETRLGEPVSQPYWVFSLHTVFRPQRPGNQRFDDIRIYAHYPTLVDRFRDGYGALVVREVTLLAAAAALELQVLDVPTEGRPPSWTGAVGQYSIETQTDRTSLAVGEPLRLTIDLVGPMAEGLMPPALDIAPELQRDFVLPPGPLAGTTPDPDRKQFSLLIRPKHANVRQVPPIAFSFFDPVAETYQTLASQAIPLEVRPGIAPEPQTAVADGSPGPAPLATAPRRPAPWWHNARLSPALTPMALALSDLRWFTTTASAGPAIFALALLLRRARQPGGWWDRRTRNLALRHHIRNVARARPGQLHRDVVHALARICGLPPDAQTASTCLAALRTRGLDPVLLARLTELLNQCEQLSYAGLADHPHPSPAAGQPDHPRQHAEQPGPCATELLQETFEHMAGRR